MKSVFFPKLDSLRFIAFFLVFWEHGFMYYFRTAIGEKSNLFSTVLYSGKIGVHIFFVLSGFLITYLLIEEFKLSKKINFLFFYMRRTLRIWPLYFLIIILGLFILPFFINSFSFCGSYWKNLLFLNNFDFASTSICYAPNVIIAWSVAIEEQFYLVWPLVFLLLMKSAKHWIFYTGCFALFCFSIIYSYVNINTSNISYHTFSNISFLISGCMGAYIFGYSARLKNILVKAGSNLVIIIVAIIGINLFKYIEIIQLLSMLVLPFLYLLLVVNLTSGSAETSKKRYNLQSLGKYTYGMYLYHPMMIMFSKITFDKLHLNYYSNAYISIAMAGLAFVATIIISVVSYNYYERFFLELKKKFTFIKTR